MEPPTRTQTACPNAHGKKGGGDSQQASARDQHHCLGKKHQKISAEELEILKTSHDSGFRGLKLNDTAILVATGIPTRFNHTLLYK